MFPRRLLVQSPRFYNDLERDGNDGKYSNSR